MVTFRPTDFQPARPRLREKIWRIDWLLILMVGATAGVGLAMLFSAANGDWQPWATRQAVRFGVGFVLMITIALIDIRDLMRYAYLIYGLTLALLLGVEFVGSTVMGAQRWVNLYFFQLQPSELMKIALILALARYFHGLAMEEVGKLRYLLAPVLLVAAPVYLILRQPDLGTAIMLALGGGALFFLAGVRMWKFALLGIGTLAAAPVAWNSLHDYQKDRIWTFLDPERDPLGSGYHILQSKIAMGSGGLSGKGFVQGTQSQLNFLPEKHTDFIFTILAEEFGLFGGLTLLGLYALIMIYSFIIATRANNQFGRLLAMGIAAVFSLYAFINIAMVMGVTPVVGVPLPLISYGGTAMMTMMLGFGLLMNIHVHRDIWIGRHWSEGA